ncbi:site-specific integrase, partial [Paraglaciecola chathamensis]|uniref:site-specific integrase n=1 Tax=Paraglaciecola chathamensis TaxID=368405 RepID=UPI00270F9650
MLNKPNVPDNQPNNVSKCLSFDGYSFDSEEELWVLNRQIQLPVGSALKMYSDKTSKLLRETLIYFAENKSAGYVRKLCFSVLVPYCKTTNSDSFDEKGMLAFKKAFSHKSKQDIPSTLRAMLRQADFLGIHLLTPDTLSLINEWKFSGRSKGIPVASMDPLDGPLSDIEHEALIFKLDNTYANRSLSNNAQVDDEEYSIVQLLSATGRRPTQIASLKIKDVGTEMLSNEEKIFTLNMPRAKQNGGHFRSSFTKVGVIDSIGQVLNKHIENVVSAVECLLDKHLSDEERGELPLFPMGFGVPHLSDRLERLEIMFFDTSLLPDIRQFKSEALLAVLKTTDFFHCTSAYITGLLKQTVNKLNIVSERTGEKLYINCYRFRYTLGTKAAREGCGLLTIANLLDHSDTQHADVYIKNIPEIAKQISKIMNPFMLKYATAFLGKVVQDEKEAENLTSKASRIPCREINNNIGSCGTNSYCTDNAPIACYTCPKFMPWKDAPHHLVLEWLLKERERIVKLTDDLTIAAIN